MRDWWKYVLIGLVVFLAAYGIALLFFGVGWGRPWMIGRWMMARPGIERGFYFPHLGVFGWLALLGRFLIPLLLLALAAVGLAALLRGPDHAARPAPTCPNCRRPLQAGWVACPYCGQDLRPGEPTH